MTLRSGALRCCAAALAAASALSIAADPGAAAPTCGHGDFRATALARINAVRAAGASCGSHGRFGPAPAVAWSEALAGAAEAHARDMRARDNLSHVTGSGATLADRVGAVGYRWASLGENIAGGYPSIDAVVAGWVKSPGHCKNLMTAKFTDAGLACVPGSASSRYPNYWALNLGRPL